MAKEESDTYAALPADATALNLTPFGDAIAGASGALVANALVYPIDV